VVVLDIPLLYPPDEFAKIGDTSAHPDVGTTIVLAGCWQPGILRLTLQVDKIFSNFSRGVFDRLLDFTL
jgi:hypothetical protein